MSGVWLPKGARVRVRMLQAQPLGTYSLAGQQMKVAARSFDFTGTVRHLRGDRPVNVLEVLLYVEPDDPAAAEGLPLVRAFGCTCTGHGETVEVGPEHVVPLEGA